jgi:hypothetical protein
MLSGEEWEDFNRPSAGIETRLKEACSIDFERTWSVSRMVNHSDIYLFIYLFG